jgi:GNAT superfamily N-acetyltransferase
MADGDASFGYYLRSLIGSWEALASLRPDASVVRGEGYAAARFPEPYLNNAVVLEPRAVASAARTYPAGEDYALWCRDDDARIAAALADSGYVHSETTRPMLRQLAAPVAEGPPAGSVLVDADRDRFAEFIEVPAYLLRDVADLCVYASVGFDSGLVVQYLDSDAYVSMVYTAPESRGRGLATAVLAAAMNDAYRRGASTATLQATPMAESMYERNGFRPVGRWQEWVLANPDR